MGIYTIVTDYLENSPAKQFADKSYMHDIKDIGSIVKMCRRENIDGVISGYIDPCQKPYQEICESLGLPCYGEKKQFYKMTDKHAFKNMCIDNGIDVIPEYTICDAENNNIEYPVFVKPVDSRGSRGQSICYNSNELRKAIELAKKESSNGDILIEKYMQGAHEFQVTYFYIDGRPYLIRTVDSYCGTEEAHLENLVACAVSPSRFTQTYLDNAHEKVIRMFENLGIKNGPIFMQGFEDNGRFRFFDPGLRFPGVDYENIYKKVFGIDIMRVMINFALYGKCGDIKLPEDGVWINQKRAAVLFPTVSAGIIGKLEGFKAIGDRLSVVSVLPRCEVGDTIGWTFNVEQRVSEIDIVANSTEELKKEIQYVQNILKVYDENGNDMIYSPFDVERII
jgi:biotin carboxylase